MADLEDGESVEVQGSGSNRYTLRNVGEVYSCSCPAWRNQSLPIEKRTCKHLKAFRGEDVEAARVGAAVSKKAAPSPKAGSKDTSGVPPILLANPWDNDQDLTGFWVSEKLDGVRAYWDGQQLISRLGNRYFAPAWFVKDFPPYPLDGELWGGRKKFQRTVSIVRRQDESDLWKEILYVVFDAPAHDGTFEERMDTLRGTLQGHPSPYIKLHPQEACEGLAHVRNELARVESLGGEGLMMRKPGSRYEVGRSSTLLKVKSFFDAEAIVVEHTAGTGKHQGKLGALVTELADGTRFSIGTGFSDKERGQPPKIGSIVTFRYQELSDLGVPRFPSFVGTRDDIQWPPDNALKGKSAVVAQGNAGAQAAPAPKAAPSASPSPASTEASSKAASTPAVQPSAMPPAPRKPGVRRLEKPGTPLVCDVERRAREVSIREGSGWTQGSSFTKEFPSESDAENEAAKLIAAKLAEGFVELEV